MPEHATKTAVSVGPRGAEVTAEGLIACRFASRFVDVTGQTRALANLAGVLAARFLLSTPASRLLAVVDHKFFDRTDSRRP